MYSLSKQSREEREECSERCPYTSLCFLAQFPSRFRRRLIPHQSSKVEGHTWVSGQLWQHTRKCATSAGIVYAHTIHRPVSSTDYIWNRCKCSGEYGGGHGLPGDNESSRIRGPCGRGQCGWASMLSTAIESAEWLYPQPEGFLVRESRDSDPDSGGITGSRSDVCAACRDPDPDSVSIMSALVVMFAPLATSLTNPGSEAGPCGLSYRMRAGSILTLHLHAGSAVSTEVRA